MLPQYSTVPGCQPILFFHREMNHMSCLIIGLPCDAMPNSYKLVLPSQGVLSMQGLLLVDASGAGSSYALLRQASDICKLHSKAAALIVHSRPA